MTEVAERPETSEERTDRRHLSVGQVVIGVLALVFLVVGANGGSYQGKLQNVEKNNNSAFLPSSAQSTEVANQAALFQSVQTDPGFVVYQRQGGLTSADRAAIAKEAKAFRSVRGVAPNQVGQPEYAAGGTTAAVAVPLVAQYGKVGVEGSTIADVEKAVLKLARADAPAGLVVHSAGTGPLLVALVNSFSGIDGTLLIAAVLVVVLILLIVYRSPFVWFFPLLGAVLALGTASLIVYYLAEHNVLTLNGQSGGILSVLVLGAGTDYALLLTSRYREELHNYPSRVEAMTKAWRQAATAIVASGGTVILGLLTLGFGELNSDRSLGPVAAIGIACTLAVMLTFLPAVLTLMPRGVFWPRVPPLDRTGGTADQGAWSAIARFVGRNDRRAWSLATLVLAVCAVGVLTLKASALPESEGFTNDPDAVVGQQIYDAHFPQGSGAPAQVTASVASIPKVIAALERVPGVATAPGSVCVEPDYARMAAHSSSSPVTSTKGCPPPQLSVSPRDGRLLVDADLDYGPESSQAYKTVVALRAAVAAIPGAHALVGGQAATNYDTNQAAIHDRDLIIPIVLAVILVVLVLLLRALLIPVLLILSVVLSFAASLGISAVFFNHVFHYANADPTYPLFVFVFLVALGVDYTIFLMTRVREETLFSGTESGVLRGLAVTGGVITSAGLVLAATFAVLRVIPLVIMAELGFTVALGVLLDTMVVRSVLVPALAHDIGKRIWWPSRLARGAD